MKNPAKAMWLAAAVVVMLAGSLSVTRAGRAEAQTPPAPAAAPAQAAAPVFRPAVTMAFVDTISLASGSRLGQSFAAELDSLRERKNTELAAKRQDLQAAQQKLQDALSMTDAARAALQRDVDRIGGEHGAS